MDQNEDSLEAIIHLLLKESTHPDEADVCVMSLNSEKDLGFFAYCFGTFSYKEVLLRVKNKSTREAFEDLLIGFQYSRRDYPSWGQTVLYQPGDLVYEALNVSSVFIREGAFDTGEIDDDSDYRNSIKATDESNVSHKEKSKHPDLTAPKTKESIVKNSFLNRAVELMRFFSK